MWVTAQLPWHTVTAFYEVLRNIAWAVGSCALANATGELTPAYALEAVAQGALSVCVTLPILAFGLDTLPALADALAAADTTPTRLRPARDALFAVFRSARVTYLNDGPLLDAQVCNHRWIGLMYDCSSNELLSSCRAASSWRSKPTLRWSACWSPARHLA